MVVTRRFLISIHAFAFALLVAGAFFMENLDGTVIATALPQMAQSFGVSPVDLNMGMTAYMLTLAVCIPVSGWVADRVGARTVFAGAIGVFTLASILCGMSNGLWAFTAARVLQGRGSLLLVASPSAPASREARLRRAEARRETLRARQRALEVAMQAAWRYCSECGTKFGLLMPEEAASEADIVMGNARLAAPKDLLSD